MATRHQLDTSLRFDRKQQLPDTRNIEVPDLDPIPEHDPPTTPVSREPYLASRSSKPRSISRSRSAVRSCFKATQEPERTRLAHAVAFALGLPLEEAYIKSTSRAQDLLYAYDAVRRLYDAQLQRSNQRVRDVREYIRLGPLGRAIARAASGRRSIVLIDEIDKADIDFPNDMLRELDRLAFEIPEAPGLRFAVPEDRPDLRPVIFVTNNEEKTLPGCLPPAMHLPLRGVPDRSRRT